MKTISLLFLSVLLSSSAFAALPCKSHEPGCDKNFFKHYESLETALQKAVKANPELIKGMGEELESAYQSAWLQRYEGGMIIHLSQRVPFTAQRQESHEGSSFILRQDSGEFFFHWSPRVTGIYDADLFKSILSSYPQDASLLGWPQGSKISDSDLVQLFRPHSESSPKNLSGGLAVLYAMYRLDQYIGRPVEQQFTRMILRKNYKNGYLLVGMPTSVASAPANSADMKYRDDVKQIFIFTTEKEPKGDTNTDKYSGGKKFKAGKWKSVEFEAGKLEEKYRPQRGLFRK